MPQDISPKPAKTRDFCHLHLHSDYSLLQSTIQLKPLAKRLNELEMSSCAITDYGNMFGAVSFFNAMTYNGIKPIIGYEAYFRFDSRLERSTAVNAGERAYYNLILLAKDIEGYKNLVHLASKAYTDGFYYKPRIDMELLAERSGGLIGLSGGMPGPIGHFLYNDNQDRALANAKAIEDVLGKGNFFLEISDSLTDQGKQLIKDTSELSKSSGIPLV
ncbi:MAG TPA: PHP domain-containing protein, partial [Pyrinomonadaceae bacterium]|nr:PHP domain-containing protein [Pyrinomonadaceae bacterium]